MTAERVQTIADFTARYAGRQADALAFRYLKQTGEPQTLSYGELHQQVVALAGELAGRVAVGDRILLMFQPGLDFIVAFIACQRAGAIPVPLSLPRARERDDRLTAIVADCTPTLVLTHGPARRSLEGRSLGVPVLEIEAVEGTPESDPRPAPPLAFIQYTSGSTGGAKGVMVTHENLLANMRLISDSFDSQKNARTTVSWLPSYHDMGLVGTILVPLFKGASANLMAPGDFLRDPLGWLKAISQYKAEIAGGPNFAYDLCAKRLSQGQDGIDPMSCDLSSWRVAFVGAEPVRYQALQRFAAAAAPYGFHPDSFLPCYGLAEGTLFVDGIGGAPNRLACRFDTAAMQSGNATPAAGAGIDLVACGIGRQSDGTHVLVVDPDSLMSLPEGRIGELWIDGPGVAKGYWGANEANAAFGHRNGKDGASYFRTGDLGFMRDGRLYISGRLSDLIIVRGVNHFPQDLEETAGGAHSALPAGRAAAFGVEEQGETAVIVVHEMPREGRRSLDAATMTQAIRTAILDSHGLSLKDVLMVKPGALPMTSSGKIQRGRCREMYLAGGLAGLIWPQAEPSTRATASRIESAPSVKTDIKLVDHLRRVIADVLERPVEEVDPTAPLTSFPLDSLKVVEVQMLLEARFGWSVPAEGLQSNLTLLDLMDKTKDFARRGAGVFWSDAALPTGLMPPTEAWQPGGDILVTGATGFVGAYLVAELLRRLPGKVICLMRPMEAMDDRRRRLFARLAARGITQAVLDARLEIVAGDAAQIRLGLGEDIHAALAERVGWIFHNAAELDFGRSYEALKGANVNATRAILTFAGIGQAKSIAHVSSVSVLETPMRAGRRITEAESLDFPETLAVGYAQSKWVADRMMLHARDRGFRVSVFRPPWIVGGDAAGGEASGDFIARFIKGCVALGVAPESPLRWNIVPVDFVARAIAVAMTDPESRGGVYHLGLAEPVSTRALGDVLIASGHTVAILQASDWLGRLRAALATGKNNPLRPLASLFLGYGGGPSPADPYVMGNIAEMDSRHTLERLARLGIAPPTVDLRGLIESCLRSPETGGVQSH